MSTPERGIKKKEKEEEGMEIGAGVVICGFLRGFLACHGFRFSIPF
jgi:hypothetical protein